MVTWALSERPGGLDPLFAATRSDALVARQIYEPLVESLRGPYDASRRVAGLALSVLPSADRTVWRVRLRPGVRFQDGTRFNASAVLANAGRWLATAEGRGLLGSPLVDAPRPDLVRFILPAPDQDFDRVLASPRLGIVSPATLRAVGGGAIDRRHAGEGGSGAFELRERGRGRLLLAWNTGWWGTERGLGPGVDQLEFAVVPAPAERVDRLREGSAQVAGDLDRSAIRVLARDPLLSAVPSGGDQGVGIERSIRGIPAGEPAPSLNALWRTAIDAG